MKVAKEVWKHILPHQSIRASLIFSWSCNNVLFYKVAIKQLSINISQ